MEKKMVEVFTDEQLSNCILSNIKVLLCFGNDEDDVDEAEILEYDNEFIKASNAFYYFRKSCRMYTYENYLRLMQ